MTTHEPVPRQAEALELAVYGLTRIMHHDPMAERTNDCTTELTARRKYAQHILHQIKDITTVKIADDTELLCTSCGGIYKHWPDGFCPQCGTTHQPFVIRRDKPDSPFERFKIYRDKNDWWVGYYRGLGHHYVCPFPTVVIRWRRK